MSTILPFEDNLIKHIQTWQGFWDGDPTLRTSTQPLQLPFSRVTKVHDSNAHICRNMEKSHGKAFVVWGSGIPPRQSGRWCPAPPISISVQRQSCDVQRVLCVPRAPWSAQRWFTGRKKAMGMTIVTRLCLGAILATWFDTWAVSCLHLRRTLGAALCSVAKTLNYANQANKIRKLLLRALHAIWAAKAKGILKAHKRPSLNWCGRMWKVSFCWQTYCRQWWPVRQLSSSTVRRSVSWAKKLPASPGLLQYKNP